MKLLIITIVLTLITNIGFGQTAEVLIDLPEKPETILFSSRLRGFNQGDYDWLKWNLVDSYQFREEFSKVLPGIIRWPGGSNANNYIWKKYLNNETRFNLTKVVEFIRDRKIELQYTVNFGNGSVVDAANFVRLCNSNDLYWQNKRNELFGNQDPINLKICEIGNENNYSHEWFSSWFARAKDEKIHFRDGNFITFPAYVTDSLYFYGGSIWRRGWVDPTTIEVHHHKTEAILGEKYLIRQSDGDTIFVSVSYPKIKRDSIYVWAVDTVLTMAQLDLMPLSDIYNLITEPSYLLDTNYFTILSDTVVAVFPPKAMKAGELIYIEYMSVDHDGAFAFRDAIKAVDPSIQVGYNVWPNEALLNQNSFRNDYVQSPPDFIIGHTYPNTRDIQLLAENGYFSSIPYLTNQIVQQVSAIQHTLDSVSTALGITKRLGLAITEWSYADGECKDCNMSSFDGMIGALNTAMFAASYFEAMSKSLINLYSMNFQILIRMQDGSSIFNVNPYSLVFNITSRAHAMRLVNNTIGTRFFPIDSTAIIGNPWIDILKRKPNGSIEKINIPSIKIWGGIDSLYHEYSLLLINQDDSLAHTVSFTVPDAWGTNVIFVETMIGNPNSSTFNIQKDSLAIINSSVQITLQPFSICAVRFHSTNTGIDDIIDESKTLSLENAYPNPFNSSTIIAFSIPQHSHVKLKVFDILGREITTLLDSELDEGKHSVVFSSIDIPSGMYVYRLQVGKYFEQRKMIVIK